MEGNTVKDGWNKIRKYSVDLLTKAPSDILSDVPSEIVTRKRIQYGSVTDATIGIFMEYCRNSTVHGVRYLGQRKRAPLERLFWIAVFVVSINICVNLTLKIYDKWNDTPVIVSFAEKATSIWEIPFPSVIVCSETKTRTAKFNFTEAFLFFSNRFHDETKTININDTYKFQSMLHLCNLDLLAELKDMELIENLDIVENLKEIAPSMNESSPFCKWHNRIEYCENIFVPVVTDDGICYQFNGLNKNHLFRKEIVPDPLGNEVNDNESDEPLQWNLENGYFDPTNNNAYPQRVQSDGAIGGMYFAVQGFDYDLEYVCRDSSDGFKIFLQSPDEPSNVAKHFIRVPYEHEVLISIRPNLVATSENLRQYPPQRRQCFFMGERYLRYFKIYSQNNCNFECLVNKTIERCGCAKFSMPRPAGVRVCGISDILCYQKVEDNMYNEEFEHPEQNLNLNIRGKTYCNCLPACSTLTYDFEISQTKFDARKLLEAFRETYIDENPGFIMSRVTILFKQNQFNSVKRSELYGTTDFIANCGGLFNLFMGVSLVSLIELIYFFSARLTTNLLMRKAKKKVLYEFPEKYFEIFSSEMSEKNSNYSLNEKIQ